MSNATKAVAAKSAAAQVEDVTPYYKLDELVTQYQTADVTGTEQQSVFDAAKAALANVSVVKARTVYLIATHEDVLTPKTRKAGVNLSGAATVLKANRTTLIPYLTAGEALVKAGVIHEDGITPRALEVVGKSLDATSRQASKDARDRARAKAEAGKVAMELAGKTADGKDVPAPAPAKDPVPATAGAEQAVKQAVESKGTLSVTEEPAIRQSTDSTPEPIAPELPEGETEVFEAGRLLALLRETARHLAGFVESGNTFTKEELAEAEDLAIAIGSALIA